jgi:hypothetical protein
LRQAISGVYCQSKAQTTRMEMSMRKDDHVILMQHTAKKLNKVKGVEVRKIVFKH